MKCGGLTPRPDPTLKPPVRDVKRTEVSRHSPVFAAREDAVLLSVLSS